MNDNIINSIEEMSDGITMVESTDENNNIKIESTWSIYQNPDKLPFRDRVNLRRSRFKRNANLLGVLEDGGDEEEMTFLHWICNFMKNNIDKNKESLVTIHDFTSTIHFQYENSLYQPDTTSKYSDAIWSHLKKSDSAYIKLFTPVYANQNTLERPEDKIIYFVDNIARSLVYQFTTKDDSNPQITYETFKQKMIRYILDAVILNTREYTYSVITDPGTNGIGDTKWNRYAIELHTIQPSLGYITFF